MASEIPRLVSQPNQQPQSSVQAKNPSISSPLNELNKKVTSVVEKSEPAFIGGMANSTKFMISNFGSLTRNLLITLPSNLGVSLRKDGAVSAGFAYDSLMIASAFNAGIGIISTEKNRNRMVHAAEIGDGKDYVDAGLSVGSAAAQTIGGAAVLANSPLSLTCRALGITTGITSPSLLGRVTYGVSQIASIAFGLFYAFVGIASGISIFHQVKFHSALNKAKKEGNELAFLTGLLKLTEDEITKLNVLEQKAPQKLIAEAKKMIPLLSPEVKMDKKQWEQLFEAIGDDELIKTGRVFREHKLLLKHEAQLKKVTSGESVKMLQKISMHHETTGLQPTADQKTATLKKVESAWNTKMVINSLLTFCCAFGVITTLAGFILTAGIPAAIVTSLLILAVIIPMTIVDGYSFYTEMKSGQPGKHDTKFLAFSTLVCLAAVTTSLTLIGVFSFAIMPILITLFVGTIWLGFNAFCYSRIKKRTAEIAEEKKKQEKPRNLIAEAIEQWKTETEKKETTYTVLV